MAAYRAEREIEDSSHKTTNSSSAGREPLVVSSYDKKDVDGVEIDDNNRKEWYEIIETRTADNVQAPVALFSSLEEAEMIMNLKTTFAERRAKEKDPSSKAIPVETTYTIRKTLK